MQEVPLSVHITGERITPILLSVAPHVTVGDLMSLREVTTFAKPGEKITLYIGDNKIGRKRTLRELKTEFEVVGGLPFTLHYEKNVTVQFSYAVYDDTARQWKVTGPMKRFLTLPSSPVAKQCQKFCQEFQLWDRVVVHLDGFPQVPIYPDTTYNQLFEFIPSNNLKFLVELQFPLALEFCIHPGTLVHDMIYVWRSMANSDFIETICMRVILALGTPVPPTALQLVTRWRVIELRESAECVASYGIDCPEVLHVCIDCDSRRRGVRGYVPGDVVEDPAATLSQIFSKVSLAKQTHFFVPQAKGPVSL